MPCHPFKNPAIIWSVCDQASIAINPKISIVRNLRQVIPSIICCKSSFFIRCISSCSFPNQSKSSGKSQYKQRNTRLPTSHLHVPILGTNRSSNEVRSANLTQLFMNIILHKIFQLLPPLISFWG